jgi:hypothetical protein
MKLPTARQLHTGVWLVFASWKVSNTMGLFEIDSDKALTKDIQKGKNFEFTENISEETYI